MAILDGRLILGGTCSTMTANSGVPTPANTPQCTQSPQSQVESSTIDLSILDDDASMPIAVVGLGFRGPGDATNVDKLWDMIREGREAWGPIPRWNNSAFHHPDHSRHGTINVEGGHFLREDVSLFDAPFFNMTSDEAAAMDPQQRLLLEVTYEALESAGITLSTVTGTRTSCFVGSFNADYMDLLLREPECIPMYQCTNAGQSRAMTANRVSYFFDLKGPSVTVDTACSGSLVALHLACQSLRTSDASMAIAAGVNIILSHEFMSTMTMMKFLSPRGRCRTFDEDADGYARGEAIGCLILKPLRDAIRDGDPIRAVIRGTGSNQDGRTAGITLPNGAAQEALIRHVYQTAGLDPRETEFVEAHGTGTQAGDPIETGALAKAFGPRRPDQPLRVGSIKTNVGHLEGTSGIAGVIKAILMLERRMLLPNRNFHKLNSRILAKEWNLKVQLEYEPWKSLGPHRVSVNSFGYGGSNAHAILEDTSGYLSDRKLTTFVQPQNSNMLATTAIHPCPNRQRVFMLSAFDETSMHHQIHRLQSFLNGKLEDMSDEWLNSLAFTLNERRTAHLYRSAVIGDSAVRLKVSLSAQPKIYTAPKKPVLAFVFTGQGAQWAGMGKELLETYPVFRHSIELADGYMNRIGAPFSVIDEILTPKDISRLSHPLLSQPICSALQIALVDLLAWWDIYPDAVTGHSSGEIAAAYAAGILTMEDAITIAYNRGVAASRLFERQSGGAMMAVGLSASDAQPYVDKLQAGKATVACVNSPSSITISGDEAAIDELEVLLQGRQIFARRLAVEVAYHSHHMEAIGGEYLECIAHVTPRQPKTDRFDRDSGSVQFFSSVTGAEISADELGPHYWVRNLLGQVKFVASVESLCFGTNSARMTNGVSDKRRVKRSVAARKVGVDALIEIGPHSALAGPIKQIIQADSKLLRANLTYCSVLVRGSDATTTALSVAASLACAGYPVNFQAINDPTASGERRVLVDLPPYGWNHNRSYWAEPRVSKVFRNREFPRTDILGALERSSSPLEPRWKNFIRVTEIPWLRDHKILSNIVYPGAGYIAMAIEAVSQLASVENYGPVGAFYLRDIHLRAALVIQETAPAEVMISMRQCANHTSFVKQLYEFNIRSVTMDNRWTEHCTGYVGAQETASHPDLQAMSQCESAGHLDFSVLDPAEFYEKLAAVGLEYGPCFSNVAHAHFTPYTCLAEITIPDTAAAMPSNFQYPCVLHPCILDTIIHSIFISNDLADSPAIPVQIDELIVSRDFPSEAGGRFNVCAQTDSKGREGIVASISAGRDDGPVLSMTGLRCKYIGSKSSESTTKQTERIAYKLAWKPDLDLLTGDNILTLLCAHGDEPTSDQIDESEAAALDYAQKAIVRLEQTNPNELRPSKKRALSALVATARKSQANHSRTRSAHNVNDNEAVLLSPQGKQLSIIGPSLPGILGDQTSSAMPSDAHWAAYWDSLLSTPVYQNAAELLSVMSYKNPMMSVLEVEAGEGRASLRFLQSISDAGQNIPRCGQYTVATRDADQIQSATNRLSTWSEWIKFKNLDLDKDPESQGFARGSSDIILIPYGLHTVESVHSALKALYTLLRPGGYLVMINPLTGRLQLPNAMIFATLSQSCLNILEHSDSDLVEALKKAGLSTAGIDSNPDRTRPIIARKDVGLGNSRSTHVLLIREDGDSGVCLSHLHDLLESSGYMVEVKSIAHANVAGKCCLVLSELKYSVLGLLDEVRLQKVKNMLQEASAILWVTRGGVAGSTYPESSLITGLTRTARSESGVDPIVTLDLNGENPLDPIRAAQVIHHLFRERIIRGGSMRGDSEYAEQDGMLLIPRVVEDALSDGRLASLHDAYTICDQAFHSSAQPMRIKSDPVQSELVYFVEDTHAVETPDDKIRISVQAMSLSRSDVLGWAEGACIASGWSGIVQSVGKTVHDFSVGDRVACLGEKAVSNVFEAKPTAFQKIPPQASFESAAALPVAYCMAYYAIHHLAHAISSDTVLIHGAAGIVGIAVAEICRVGGANAVLVIETEDDRLTLMKLGFPEHTTLLKNNESFPKDLTRMIGHKVVDVIINCDDDAGSLDRLWQFGADSYRIVQFCGPNTTNRARWEVPNTESGVMFATISPDTIRRLKSHIRDEVWNRVGSLFREGKIRGHSPQTYSVPQISTAMDTSLLAETGTEFIVLRAGADDYVKFRQPKLPNSLFQADASYMLVGGLGGIGRATALWMSERGARNIIFINRSGLTRESSRATAEELERHGVRVFVRAVDVTDSDRMAAVTAELADTAPPVRGVIQAAMVLRDTLIEKMSVEDYHSVLQPKLIGTWNLHRFLPKDLDFFIMLSSISGIIGNATQAAYAAGSTFMDTFAAYRNRYGLHAVSIDLGAIMDTGYLAENTELAAKMTEQGFHSTDTKTVMSLIELAITTTPQSNPSHASQIITGLGAWKEGHSLPNFDTPIFSHFRRRFQTPADEASNGPSTSSLRDELKAAKSLDEASGFVYAALSSRIATHLAIPIDSISPNNPITEYGIDSHAAVELRNWILQTAESTVPVLEILATGSISELATKIAVKSSFVNVVE
ncbi:putative polyketide synthase [Aspergillus lucknowensis]|uniref:Polyketide synthase n=1 Tax=Aspergillus lucknowensis TaxID=176173 RepID=A0ABR4L6D6_9EURO